MTDAIADANTYETLHQEHLGLRRLLVFTLCAVSWAGLGAFAAGILGGGWLSLQTLVLMLFLLSLPWGLLCLWNAIIGFVILRFVDNPASFTNPALRRTPIPAAMTTRTAICLAVRNEAVEPVFKRLEALIESLEATSEAAAFAIHILSDSDNPAIMASEQSALDKLRQIFVRPDFLHYRRRAINTGFKAGNLHDFTKHEGHNYDFMIVLDADSLMSGAAILRLVRVMQANPQLGILQTLAVAQPSSNAFTRIFQFGMRNGMRTHATGMAWWQGPDGPYWGHNAIIRVAPFAACCGLPDIPGKGPLAGPILSHDQVEAALMRRAGFEVRLIVDEFGSWEENPPDLPSFVERDLRWCQGNLQYLKLFGHIRLMPMGMFQLANAIMMYLGSIFWVLQLLAGLCLAIAGSRARAVFAIYLIMFALGFVPRLLGTIDSMLSPEQRQRYGGAGRLLLNTLADALFSILLGTVMTIEQSIFIVGLIFGRRVTWESQRRDGGGVRGLDAARGLWPQTFFGVIMAFVLAVFAPDALPWALPTLLSCLLAIPFAIITALPGLGYFMQRNGICAIPEEVGINEEQPRSPPAGKSVRFPRQ